MDEIRLANPHTVEAWIAVTTELVSHHACNLSMLITSPRGAPAPPPPHHSTLCGTDARRPPAPAGAMLVHAHGPPDPGGPLARRRRDLPSLFDQGGPPRDPPQRPAGRHRNARAGIPSHAFPLPGL